METLDLGEVLRHYAKQRREYFRKRLEEERRLIKMHVALLRALEAYRVKVEFNDYNATGRYLRVALFERDDKSGGVEYEMRDGKAYPILARTPSGRPIAGILGKLLGLRLSCARHEYPARSPDHPNVYFTDCSFLVRDGAWKGWRVYWRGLFNDRPDQKCHVRESSTPYLSIQCDVVGR